MSLNPRTDTSRVIRAPRGPALSAKSWLTEAALRMLMNNLDPEVAERPQDLVVYGGIGRAARDWVAFDRIVAALKALEADETLLIQSGKPVGVFKTHADAPRVLIANSNLVPKWATWEHFHELDRKGLMMYGQMTAGSWIYIGSQGIVQGTYETFVEAGRQHYGGSLAGKWILTAGLGGMGGAQPLAATFAGACSLNIECQQSRIDFRLRSRYLDEQARDLDDALARIANYTAQKKAVSIGLLGNAAEILPELVKRVQAGTAIRPDLVTDQTSAHDLIHGYLPARWSVEDWFAAQADAAQHAALRDAAAKSCALHVQAMLDFQALGIPTVDYGNNIRQVALDQGVKNAFDFPGFVPAYIRPLFCRGKGPFRWVALSGDPDDIRKTDAKMKELFPEDAHLHRWLDMAGERIAFQGLPARICWIGLGERHRAGLAFNQMVASGELKAPIVIGRDHLDSGSVASPNRETESMKDGSDAVSDWPLLNALLNTAGGATWVSLHHGGGVGMGYSQHSGVVIVCDGSDAAAKRIARVLWNDPATGVMRHADAGYDSAIACAREQGLKLPGILGVSMQLLRAAQHRRMAWKNGAGETTEIAVWPPDAGLDHFEWRVSMARVTRDGPFSVFAGVERTLTVLEGDGLRLAIGDAAPVDLHVGDALLSFPADVPTTATLLGGAVTDLNVMTRRGRWQHAVERHRIQGAQTLAGTAASRLWLCSDGALHLCGTAGSTDLGAGDACLVVDPEASPWRLDVQGTGTLWRIALVRRAMEPPEA